MRIGSQELLSLALKEYDALRAEVVSTVERQYSLANWGISTAALVVAAIVGGWEQFDGHPFVLVTTLILVIPALLTSYVIAWSHVITKISQLGERLFLIEENVARIVDQDSIREAYAIPASETLDPHRYLLGWEHRLCHEGANTRVQTTIHVVKVVLAAVYLLLIVTAATVLMRLGHASLFGTLCVVIAAIGVWGTAWYAVFRYLHRNSAG